MFQNHKDGLRSNLIICVFPAVRETQIDANCSSLFVRSVNHLALTSSFVSPVSPFFWPNPVSAVQLSAGTPHFWWTPSLRHSQFSSLNMQIESVIHLLGDKSATLSLSLSIMPLKIEYQINF